VYIVSVENTRNSAQLREAKGTALQTDLAPLCLSNSADERYTQLRRAAQIGDCELLCADRVGTSLFV